jgi:hypothetical protein
VLTNSTALAIAGIAASVLTSMGYTVSRGIAKSAAIRAAGGALAALLLVSAATGCASASTRETTLKVALVTTDAARDGLLLYDSQRQREIVGRAVSIEDGRARLSEYRDSRVPAVDALTIAYRAIAAAAALSDEPSLAGVRIAVDHAIAAIEALKGSKP